MTRENLLLAKLLSQFSEGKDLAKGYQALLENGGYFQSNTNQWSLYLQEQESKDMLELNHLFLEGIMNLGVQIPVEQSA